MIVIFTKAGQLGNRLFNFATFMAFSATVGNRLVNPSFAEYADFFEGTRGNLLCTYPPHPIWGRIPAGSKARSVYYRIAHKIARTAPKHAIGKRLTAVVTVPDNEMYLLDDNADAVGVFHASRITFVGGLQFRHLSGMRAHADEIRSYFTPLSVYRERISKIILEARNKSDILIGIHFRGGDYSNHQGSRYFYSVQQYRNIMQKIVNIFPEKQVGFLICSNAQLSPEVFTGFRFHFGSQHFLEDMYALAQCDYISGPPSTYSLWASFYGQVRQHFIMDPEAAVNLDDFIDFFSRVGHHRVYHDINGVQYLLINESRYNLVFRTDQSSVAV